MKKTLLALCLATGLCFWVISAGLARPQAAQPASDALLQQGIALLSAGKYDAAVASLNQYKQTSPLDPQPYFYAGMAFAQAGQLSASAAELKEAVRLAPGEPMYRIFQANVYVRLKQTTDALKALSLFSNKEKAERLNPTWLHLLADVYFRLEQPDQSLAILQILEKHNPNDARTDYELGRVYGYKNELDQAAQFYKKSIQELPENPDAYFELGRTLYQSNDLTGAKQAFLQAVHYEPNNPEFLLKLGDICLALGQPEEAIKYLKQAEPSAASYPRIYYGLGRAYQREGDRIKGDAYMKKYQDVSTAQAVQKAQVVAVDRLMIQAEDALDAGKKAEAQALFEQAVKADPGRWEAQGYLAEMSLASGDLQQAYEHLVWMRKVMPDSVVGNYLMAKYWYLSKDYKQALTYAEKAKLVRPGNSELRSLLGKIYIGLGERDKAVQEYQEAVRLAPGNAEFRDELEKLQNSKAEITQLPGKN